MSGPLLETKLHLPAPRHHRVARQRLIQRLTDASRSALTVVSAPAGFGKTTLLTQWLSPLAGRGACIAWVSLDERDSDPVVFWRYVSTALQAATGSVGNAALSLLQQPQPGIDAVLATLLNELSGCPDEVFLVLDDYHLIEARQIDDEIGLLLQHMPPGKHLIIACRADPALPLGRLRGRGELTEIRSAELRFTETEAAEYLNDVVGLALTPADVATLESRTEGWIAALQLAGLSMNGRSDASAFIDGFAGDDRYIVDYLAEEVLQRRPPPVRDFLLQTSILTRLSGPLCDAVTGRDDGKATLATLERDNLFLVALDDRRRWYRYHQLFADVLHTHLLDERPDDIEGLHRRAGDWYERNGEPAEAIRHALAGGDVAHAADLIEPAIPALRRARQDATILRWLQALPDQVIQGRPVLSIACAGALMVRGEVDGVEAHLKNAERWLDVPATGGVGTVPRPEMVVVDEQAFRAVPGAISLLRAGQALIRGDVAATVTHARRSLELAEAEDHVARGAPAGLLALAYWTGGDLESADRWYADAISSLGRAGHLGDVLGCTLAATDIRLAQGRLRDAMDLCEQALRRVAEQPSGAVPGTADMHVVAAELLCEHNQLDAARARLAVGAALGEHAGLPQNRYRRRVAMARIQRADGDPLGAIELLDEAERLYNGDFSPDVRPVAAARAGLLAAQGAWDRALQWVQERGLTVDDELSYLHEFEHITLARVLLARHTADPASGVLSDALRLLDRLLAAAERGRRTGAVLEVLVLQAVALHTAGDQPAALAALGRALDLAEPQGYVRTFADEGPPMAELLRQAVALQMSPGYARALLAATAGTADIETPSRSPGGTAMIGPLIEPLSEREADVLLLLGTDLDGPGIARRLMISVNTVRTHTQHIYSKLGVSNRRAAVSRARELGLMSSSRVTGAAPGC